MLSKVLLRELIEHLLIRPQLVVSYETTARIESTGCMNRLDAKGQFKRHPHLLGRKLPFKVQHH